MKKLTLDDCVFICMRNGNWWTYWDLQRVIKTNTGTFYNENSISASIRNFRKDHVRSKYQLSLQCEKLEKRRIENKKGWEFRLIGVGEK